MAIVACWLIASQVGQEAWGVIHAMTLAKGECKESGQATI